ncbi:MAG: redoxin domain-containing protein [Candidatus Obscuribacter sp.]|jgi:peroxiredoxin|nr:redoxin domain-containing protein [Candidatus Obscuribacter sp.]MBK9619826.1 redoxin domain-containing protein [Candidatus Obscuribacter sp.]MBK9770725.1 redoxin domain-containing protein [Candidatus Obscuribacter sp.]MBL0188797.1 redoxin domain-containing protein [Candidatus Obscuribacter sp.]MDQ5964953.1 hypothetical protein [Cyanobacteriota bacterium erpe_2018_sw_39hr_WHONDRS-SW48-000098_B_bin.30]
MNVSSKITQKLAALVVLTAAVSISADFADGGFVRAEPTKSKSSATLTEAQVGKQAPDFTLTDARGKKVSLSQFKGKLVVLEWFNHGCPFVKKHYEGGNMQSLQKTYTGQGVVWLSICSSAEGKQGFATGAEHLKAMEEKGAKPSYILIDADGKVGKLYQAKTTPHMFIVGKDGTLDYAGAIDDKETFDAADVKTAKNYVKAALDDMLKGKKPAVASTHSYGCSVKYQ